MNQAMLLEGMHMLWSYKMNLSLIKSYTKKLVKHRKVPEFRQFPPPKMQNAIKD